jgi:hypothetical protein
MFAETTIAASAAGGCLPHPRWMLGRRQGARSRLREQGMNIEKLTDRARGFVQWRNHWLCVRALLAPIAPDHLLKVPLTIPKGPRG